MMMNLLLDIDKAFTLVIQEKCEIALIVVVDSTEPAPLHFMLSLLILLKAKVINSPNGKGLLLSKGVHAS